MKLYYNNSSKRLALYACLLTTFGLFFSWKLQAQYRMENINRGVVAVRTSSSQVYVGWRMFGTDPSSVGFNVYRGSTKLNSSPITNSTNYVDNTSSNSTYIVRPVINGVEQAASESASVWTQPYMAINLQRPSGGTTPDGVAYTYSPNDCSVGDLDGDGQYEIVVKWDPSNSKDNSQSGYTGNVYLDAYEFNGTRLWRIDLGRNIRAGAHYTQFMVYDLDSDGKAEVACKTGDGTRDGQGTVIGSSSADYRNSSGYILSGPEYLTIFNGQTGAAMVTTNYVPARGNVSDWGDSYGNRVDRFLAGVAYLDGQRPSLIMCRGYYTRAVVAAWDWRNGQLTNRWTFDTNNGYSAYTGQGAHSLSVGDVDNDGRDEIVYGAATIDDNGTGKYSTGLGHGDAEHFGDLNPNRPGKEIYMVHECPSCYGAHGLEMHDAATGQILWSISGENADVGRGVSMDIDPRYAGNENWGSRGGLMSASGQQISSSRPGQMNFGSWWDGDFMRELLDGTNIDKWNYSSSNTSRLLSGGNYGAASNNSTKSTPCLSADILGDWREEVIWRNSNNTQLLVFTTTITANNRIYTLMHDPQYRVAIAWQNTAYNQPPHPSFFLGDGMSTPPTPNIVLVGGGNSCTPTAITPYVQIDGGSWSQTTNASVSSGATVKFGPQPVSGGSWSWSGPNGLSATTREITITNIQTNQAGNYIATYTNSCGSQSTATFVVTVNGGGGSITIQENTTGFCSVDGTVDNNNAGFTGSGFANTNNTNGAGVNWRVSTSSGSHTLTWRYANGGGSDRPGRVLVNGATVVSSLSFPATSNWTTWTEVSTTVTLGSGTQNIRLEATGSNGLANIDFIEITGSSVPQGVSCSGSSARTSNGTIPNEEIVAREQGVLQIVPNPAVSNQFEVRMMLEKATPVQITLVDLVGRVIVDEDTGRHAAGLFSHTIDVSKITKGTYVVKVKTNHGLTSAKLIRE